MSDRLLVCPECGSEEVTTTEISRFDVNTGELFNFVVKYYDSNSEARCTNCGWDGFRQDLTIIEQK